MGNGPSAFQRGGEKPSGGIVVMATDATSSGIGKAAGVIVEPANPTRGTKAKLEADGHTDATTHNSDGTGNESTYGIFLQSGTVGQTVGLLLSGAANRGV